MIASGRAGRGGRSFAWLAGAALAGAACLAVIVLVVTQPLLPAMAAAPAPPPGVDPARLQAHVRMLSQTLQPRDHAHPEVLERVAAYIEAELGAAGGRVASQPFEVDSRSYRNVIARFGPAGTDAAGGGGPIIVVGAHYDSAGPHPGADDNASGIAGLIELARLLGKSRLAVPIELVAYSLEEPPYFRTASMGSAVHAADLARRGVPVRAMLALEMIGYFSDTPGSQDYPSPAMRAVYPDTGNFIAVVGSLAGTELVRNVKAAMAGASDLPVRSINAPAAVPGVDFSDHLNYWQHGYPAAMVTDTAFLRNHAYHGDGDTFERLDYARMAKVVAGVYAAVLALP